MSTEKIFAGNFKKFRKIKGLSQKEFARKLSEHTGKILTLTSISNYETGMHMPTPQVLPIIAGILEVSIDALFGTDTTDEVVADEITEENPLQAWRQELRALEQDFYKMKIAQTKNSTDASLPVMACCEKLIEVAKKQQDELLILQTEVSTIRKMISLFR